MNARRYWLAGIVLMALWLVVSIVSVEKIEPALIVLALVAVIFIGVSIKKIWAYKVGIPLFAFYSVYYFLMLFYSLSGVFEFEKSMVLFAKLLVLGTIAFCLFKSKKMSLSPFQLSEEEAEEISNELPEGQESELPASDEEIAEDMPLQKKGRGKWHKQKTETPVDEEPFDEEPVEDENAEAEDNPDGNGGPIDEAPVAEEDFPEEKFDESPAVSHHCPKCGHHIDPIDRFCSNCGKRFK